MFDPILPYSRHIRTRCLATLPFVAIAGAAVGAAFKQTGEASLTVAWFAVAMCVGSYVSAMLEGATLHVLRLEPDGVNGDAVAIAWDLVLGALVGVYLSSITSVGLLEAAGVASAILFVQRMVLEKVLLGNVVGDYFMRILVGGGGTDPQYSHAAALAARGDIEGARAEYEAAIAADPKEVRAYIGLARMLRDNVRDYAGAAAVLERGLTIPQLETRISASLTRELAELQIHRLNAPGRAATLLARYLASVDNDRDEQWARALLRLAKAQATEATDRN